LRRPGVVGEADADTLKKQGYENAAAGDQVGKSGLQARYQAQLGGTPTSKVLIKGPSGQEIATLASTEGKPGAPVKTTIDPRVQALAEKVMAENTAGKNASIVAIDTKTGGILAAANNPATGSNRAFEGHYAPGSTFKTVTAAALIQSGLKPSDPAPCDPTVVVNGQTFKNYDDLQPIPNANFGTDFAMSCNTGFISQRNRIQDDTLNKVASDVFGIGQTWDVGATTFDGSVPPAESPNKKAASMIGQGDVQASPLVMASVAATIASGTFNQPYLVDDPALKKVASKPVDPALAAQLKALMQGVVQGGTASMLKGVPGTVGAKTGTAEFSENGAILTNGWMIAFKDDIAVAVIVEKGKSGGSAAGPVVQAFLGGV
jgi:cell division protein FtsI/penicillin-binding protein 2